jgi:hypothetical protein
MDKLPAETQGYVTKIDTYYRDFKSKQGATANTENVAATENKPSGVGDVASAEAPKDAAVASGAATPATPAQPAVAATPAVPAMAQPVMPAPSAQPDITTQIASSKVAAKNDVVVSDTQTKLLSEQNNILNQIANILTGISKNSGLGEDGSKLLAGKLDSLINAVSSTKNEAVGTGNTRTPSNEKVAHVGTTRKLPSNGNSGIDVSRSLAYS